MARMEEWRIPRKVLEGHFDGKRMVGRPRIQWEEMVTVDAKNLLGIRNWRTMARHRDDWKALIGGGHGPEKGRGAIGWNGT